MYLLPVREGGLGPIISEATTYGPSMEADESFCELDILGMRLHTNKHLYNHPANNNMSPLSPKSYRLSDQIEEDYELSLELFLDLL